MAFRVKFFKGRMTAKSAGFFRAHDSYKRKIISNVIARSKNHKRRAVGLHKAFGGGWVQ